MKFCCEPMMIALRHGLFKFETSPCDGGLPIEEWRLYIAGFRYEVKCCPFCGEPLTIKMKKSLKDLEVDT